MSNAASSVAPGILRHLVAVAALFLCALPGPAAARGFGQGVSLNNWFTWPRYAGWDKPGVLTPAYVPIRHEQGKAALATIRTLGFKTLRLGVDPAPFIALEGEARAEAKAHVLGAVRQALDTGMDVILDIHPNSRHKIYGQFAVIRGPDDEMFRNLLGVIGDFAGDLSRLPAGRVALEVMNEPRLKCQGDEQERWNTMLDAMIGAARRVSPKLPVIISGSCMSAYNGLLALDPGRWNDPNLIFTFHFYEPFVFTHQNAAFIAWPEKHLRNLPWPPRPAQDMSPWMNDAEQFLQTVPEETRSATRANVQRVLAQYLLSGANRGTIDKRFAEVGAWADKHGVARNRIHIGEFGVWSDRGPRSGATCADRARWLRDFREASDRAGFIWTFFHYDGPFGIVRDKPTRTIDGEAMKALGLAKTGSCPAE